MKPIKLFFFLTLLVSLACTTSDKTQFENTEKIAKVTHWDSRCVGSCAIVTFIISSILSQNTFPAKEEIIAVGEKYDYRIKPFVEKSFSANINNLELDEQYSIGYTLKALSAGLWVYFNSCDFESGILKIINEGGDADTNACVAGSILGAKFGYKSIPKKYIDGLINRIILENTGSTTKALPNSSIMAATSTTPPP